MECKNCEKWEKNIAKLREQWAFLHNRPAAPEYSGDEFEYCPWCGNLLGPDLLYYDVLEGAKGGG